MNENLLADFIIQTINGGINAIAGIKNKTPNQDPGAITAAIDALDSQIQQSQLSIEEFKNNELIVLNNQRLIEIYNNYKTLFLIFNSYVIDTGGSVPYNQWYTAQATPSSNFYSKFGQTSPSALINTLQPIWYMSVDRNNDGNIEIIPETQNGVVVRWNTTPSPSGILYKTLRNAITQMPSSASLTNRATSGGINVGGCQNPKYTFKIRQGIDAGASATKQFYGFVVDRDPKLFISVFAACPGFPPTELFTMTINANIFFTITQNSQGNLSLQSEFSTQKAIGKIKYNYYYDFKDVLYKFYENVTQTKISTGEYAHDNIVRQYQDSLRPFVDNFGPNMGNSPGLAKQDSFYKNAIPPNKPTGFATTLPASIQQFTFATVPPAKWFDDVVLYGAMTNVENFFYMGSTEYKNLVQTDIKTSTFLREDFRENNWNKTEITAFIDSRVGKTVEQFGSTIIGGGTGGSTGGTANTGGTAGNIGFNEDNDGNILGLDEWGETKTVPYYGKLSYKFKIANDCSSPKFEVGFGWNLISDKQNAREYDYNGTVRSLITETSGGEITGAIIDVLRGNRSDPKFTNLLADGLTPTRISQTTGRLEKIPGESCLVGTKEDYQWGMKRRRKVPYKVFCNRPGVGTVEINYRTPNTEAWKWVVATLLSGGISNFPVAKDAAGKLLTTVDGYFYSLEEEVAPIVPRFSGEPGVYFSSFTNITRVGPEDTTCVPKKRVVSSWAVDKDNPCGCDEVEILTHYLVYDEIKYNNPLYGTTETIPAREIFDPAYPEPLPGSNAFSYNLRLGQELTQNRRQKPDCFEGTGEGRLHHPFLYGTDILPGQRKRVIKGLFNLSQSLECYHTSSLQTDTQKEYYYEVTDCDGCGRTAYFAVSYGNKNGSGSLSSGYESDDSPSKAIYSQYRLLALDPHEKEFTFYNFGSENTPNDIYVINFYRNGLSDKLDIGNFEINIAELSGSGKANNVHTGSNVQVSGSNPNVITLIDDSSNYDSMDVCSNDDPLYVYSIVSGSLRNGIHTSGTGSLSSNEEYTTFGYVYPNLGVIVLDASKLNMSASFNTVTGSNIAGDNAYKLFTAISGAAVVEKPIRARNVKFKTTNHYFVRIPSSEANYSNNPTYVIDSGLDKGKIKNFCFVDNPTTYITTIGLYNSKRELIAVAKLSRPIKKTKENDILVKIRLNW
jgi:hypothetical protein